MKLLVFQAWFLKCKLLAKWFSFQEQQIPSVLLMSCDYNFIEIFNFWETKVCLGFSQKKFISKFRECQSKKLNFSPGFARTWAYFRSTDFPKKNKQNFVANSLLHRLIQKYFGKKKIMGDFLLIERTFVQTFGTRFYIYRTCQINIKNSCY